MKTHLDQLKACIPPPSNARGRNVDWNRLESKVGITYPQDFKDFIKTYGGSMWFDRLAPFCSTGETEERLDEYVQSLNRICGRLRDLYYEDEKPAVPNLYPTENGLFPFIIGVDGYFCLWRTEGASDDWPIVMWSRAGDAFEIGQMSMTQMLLEWVQRKPGMMRNLGDVDEFRKEDPDADDLT